MIRNVKVGQVITDVEGNIRSTVSRKYTVTNVYPHHVLAKRTVPGTGAVIKKSFSYGTLIVMGLEKQSARHEFLRNMPECLVPLDIK